MARSRARVAGLLLIAALLNLWALDQNGWANDYYSAAVRSMSQSWHAFLYGSFDSAGVMTVDKPPLALWVQTLSVKAFGFDSLSILVPQALMGVASVALIYDLTRRIWGRTAGFAAGLVLAVTPMTVAISRHNNPDALLILCCVAALWFVVRAFEDGRTRWLVLAGIAVGLGFETKMAVALMVVPGIAAAWLWIAPRGRLVALGQLLWGGLTMVVVGLAWPVVVWLTPAADRPWVSGTSDNSIWSLILGYNGLGRLSGQAGGAAHRAAAHLRRVGTHPAAGHLRGVGAHPAAAQIHRAGVPVGGYFAGVPGPGRLLDLSLGAQAGWLLGVALVGAIGILVATRLRPSDTRSAWLIAVGGAFAVIAVAFSYAAGIFHAYYVSLLAPFTAALVGATVALMLRGGRTGRVVAPLAVAAGVVVELIVLADHPAELSWLKPVLIVAGAAAAVALALQLRGRVRAVAVVTVIGVLLVAPATWATQTLGYPTNATFPVGGPANGAVGSVGMAVQTAALAGRAGPSLLGARPHRSGASGLSLPPARPRRAAHRDPFGGNRWLGPALRYARAHGDGNVAVASQAGAATAVLRGADVVAIGGFSGRESKVSVTWLAEAIQDGQIRWVLTDGGLPVRSRDGRIGARAVMATVAHTCAPVPRWAYSASTSTRGGTLYDCQGFAGALLAAA